MAQPILSTLISGVRWGNQFQEGSYFCLRSDKFQIIGIDTAYFEVGRCAEPELLAWLKEVLRVGKKQGCVNICLVPMKRITTVNLNIAFV